MNTGPEENHYQQRLVNRLRVPIYRDSLDIICMIRIRECPMETFPETFEGGTVSKSRILFNGVAEYERGCLLHFDHSLFRKSSKRLTNLGLLNKKNGELSRRKTYGYQKNNWSYRSISFRFSETFRKLFHV